MDFKDGAVISSDQRTILLNDTAGDVGPWTKFAIGALPTHRSLVVVLWPQPASTIFYLGSLVVVRGLQTSMKYYEERVTQNSSAAVLIPVTICPELDTDYSIYFDGAGLHSNVTVIAQSSDPNIQTVNSIDTHEIAQPWNTTQFSAGPATAPTTVITPSPYPAVSIGLYGILVSSTNPATNMLVYVDVYAAGVFQWRLATFAVAGMTTVPFWQISKGLRLDNAFDIAMSTSAGAGNIDCFVYYSYE